MVFAPWLGSAITAAMSTARATTPANIVGATSPETSDPVNTLADVRVRQRYAPGGIDEDAQEAAVTAWHQAAGPLLALLPGRVLRSFTRSIR